MNKVYKVVRSQTTGQSTVTSELAKGKTKSTSNSLVKITALLGGIGMSLLVSSETAYAACDIYSPASGQVVTCTGRDTVPVNNQSVTSGNNQNAKNVTVNVTSGASLDTFYTAIQLGGSTTINNSGLIQNAALPAISLQEGGHHITNNAGASIISNAPLSTVNAGGDAIHFYSGNLTNPSSPSTKSTLDNYGTIFGTFNGVSSSVFLETHNYQGGHISSTYGSGVLLINNGTLINDGTIEGQRLGAVRLDQNGTVINTATGIIRNSGTDTTVFPVGVYAVNGGTITNDGLIEGINYGVVTSAQSAKYATVVTNGGTITARAADGEGIVLANGGLLINQKTGVISGDVGARAFSQGTQRATIDNYGTITGTGGLGVAFNTPSNKLIMRDAAVLNGAAVSFVTLGNSIDFYGSGTYESDIANFESLTMQGVDWKLAGDILITGSVADATHVIAGKLTLTGDLDHADFQSGGGATIDSGATLQLGNGGTSGMVISGNIVDNGTLVFNRSDIVTYSNIISGTGDLEQAGSGTLNITSAQTYAGTTTVSSGTLALDSTGALTGAGAITVMDGATLGGFGSTAGDITNDGVIAAGNALDLFSSQAVGNFTSSGSLINNNLIQLGGSNGAGNTLTVAQDYISNDGYLNINTVLGDDASLTDKLIVGKDTSGNTTVLVINVGGTGAATLANGIEIVSVGGSSNGTFQLGQRVTAGLYEYDIYQGGVGTSTDDGNWYLRTLALPPDAPIMPVVNPESAVYLRNLNAASMMFMHTLHDRLGEPQFTDPYKTDDNDPSSAWVRVVSNHTNSTGGNGQVDVNTDANLVHLGTDIARWSNDGNDRWIVGVMGAYGQSKIDASAKYFAVTPSGFERNATGKVDGYSVGGYATWYQNKDKPEGIYVDTWAQYGWYDNKVQGNTKAEESYNSNGWTASVEAGYAMIAREEGNNHQLMFEPQIQVAYNSYSSDDHTDASGTRITDDNANGVIARVGARLYSRSTLNDNGIQPFLEANWWYSDAKNSLAFNGEIMSDGTPNNRYELKTGLQGEIAKDWLMWGHVGVQFGENDFNRYEGMVGIKRMF